MHKQLLRLVFYLMFVLLWVHPALCWQEQSAANVLVFNSEGEIAATYHLDDWTTEIQAANSLLVRQEWKAGSPPLLVSEEQTGFTVSAGEVVLPNSLNGASTAPTAGTPAVSMYTFDEAFFESIAPNVPGLAVSQPAGSYTNTIALEFTCLPWPGALKGVSYIEIFQGQQWVRYGSPHTVYLAESANLQVRAVYVPVFNAPVITEKTFSYTITHPENWNRDSDEDGFPDVWEIAHGLNPLSSASSLTGMTDSDGDGMSDIDELLRGSDPADPADLPSDQDGDGWSNWDEEVRGTSIDDDTSVPTATRLYEVELKLSGVFSGGPGTWGFIPYSIETLGGEFIYSHTAKLDGSYGISRFPMGREALIRAIQPGDTDNDGDTDSDDAFMVAVSRYLPMIPDPNPADVAGEWTTAAEWQALFKQFLSDQLVVSKSNFNVTPEYRAELGLLARTLELEGAILPEAWFGFGSFGHAPSFSALDELGTRLSENDRNLNSMVADFSAVLDSGCLDLRDNIFNFSVTVPVEGVEEATAVYLQNRTGSYVAALLAHYSYAELGALSWSLCEVLDPDNDLDNDLVPAYIELSLANEYSNPFLADSDQDGINDDLDNCPATANAGQEDSDGDSLGDVCDDDDDNDGLSDGTEMAFGSNPFDSDTDNDGNSDAEEWVHGTHPGVSVYITAMQSPTSQSSQIVTGYRYSGAAVFFTIDGGAVRGNCSLPTETSWACEINNLVEEKIYNISLQADYVGESGYYDAEIVVDLTAPLVSISSPVNGSAVLIENPLLSFSAEEGTVEVLLDGVAVNVLSGQNLPVLAPGTHSVRVEATDEAGNTGFAETSFVVDEALLDRVLAVTPGMLDFGAVDLETTSVKTLVVTNLGQAPVTIGNIGSGDGLGAPFAFAEDTCSGKTIGFQETCTVRVQVFMAEEGHFSDSFDLPSNDLDNTPLSIPVSAEIVFPWTMFLPALMGH